MAYYDSHSLFMGHVTWPFGFAGSHHFCIGKLITGIIWPLTTGLLGVGVFYDF